jgi:hypothetical protein
MSGIYLIIWNKERRDASSVLKPTKGGWPHLTLTYTGKQLSKQELVKTATQVFQAWMLETVTIIKAEVNSFEDRPGHMRHDVLLMVNKIDEIEQLRETYLRQVYANHADFTMRNPHITHGIYEERAQAEEIAFKLNQNVLPFNVVVTGVTID